MDEFRDVGVGHAGSVERVQPSLRDGLRTSTMVPGVETPGYCQTSSGRLTFPKRQIGLPVESNLPMKTFEQIAELERRYLLGTYNRYPIALTRGKGVFLYDLEDRRYLDFVAGLGVNALGHAHPRIVKTIREQAAKLIHVSNLYYHEYQGELAEKLCTLSGLSRAFFSNSGTEAIEGSIKLARLAGHRAGGEAKCRLVALDGSYHGRTFGALSLTGQEKHRKGFEPLLEEVTFVPQNDIAALRGAINENTCAIVLEPIFGEGGILE